MGNGSDGTALPAQSGSGSVRARIADVGWRLNPPGGNRPRGPAGHSSPDPAGDHGLPTEARIVARQRPIIRHRAVNEPSPRRWALWRVSAQEARLQPPATTPIYVQHDRHERGHLCRGRSAGGGAIGADNDPDAAAIWERRCPRCAGATIAADPDAALRRQHSHRQKIQQQGVKTLQLLARNPVPRPHRMLVIGTAAG